MHSTLVELSTFDLLSVDGEDSKKFLQGQFSCNTQNLNTELSLMGALCNVKGRVISDFRLFEYQQTCFIQLSSGMAEIVKSVLDKYIVFSKAETNIVNNRFRRYGLLGNDAHRVLEELFTEVPMDDGAMVTKEEYVLIKVPGFIPRYEIWQDSLSPGQENEHSSDLISAIQAQSAQADAGMWNIEDIKSGIAHIGPGTSEQFLPEALNYDLSGVIDFNKGCYTGQEIIARMFYRGTAKKRLFHAHGPTTSTQPISVSHQHNNTLVTDDIISLEKTADDHCHLLVILPTDAVETGVHFHLSSEQNSQLELSPLPYSS